MRPGSAPKTSERVSGYLVDTSVFIAAEQQRLPEDEPPEGDARVSVATLTELMLGVHNSAPGPVRDLREHTLDSARGFLPLPYDEAVAVRLAALLASLRSQGRRAGLMDAIIAATALAHDLAVWTLDDDFRQFRELEPELVVHAAGAG